MDKTNNTQKDIVVMGIGYVGLATGLSLASSNRIHFVDVDPNKIMSVNKGICPITEPDLQKLLTEHSNNIEAKKYSEKLNFNADYVFLALPTNFDETTNGFDTTIIEEVLENLSDQNTTAMIILKSTIPIGFTQKMQKRHKNLRLVFVPEFLREGSSVADTKNPSRIVIGDNGEPNNSLIEMLVSVCSEQPPVFVCGSTEAEAIKIFSNTYLACRVAFFNEIDSFCLTNGLNAGQVISGMGADQRIGAQYNNPSFGYGGYCLPKDTLQAISSLGSKEYSVINSIHTSNQNRLDILAEEICKKEPKVVGVYKPVMKAGSDNFRESSSIALAKKLQKEGIKVIIFEPILKGPEFLGIEVRSELSAFLNECDVILANRLTETDTTAADFFTRDIYHVG